MKLIPLFAPAVALFGWAIAAALGVEPSVLRIAGPAATGVGCAAHVIEELRLIRARR